MLPRPRLALARRVQAFWPRPGKTKLLPPRAQRFTEENWSPMFLRRISVCVIAATVLLPLAAFAQKGEGRLNPAPPANISADQIIQRFAAKESEFKGEWSKYTYRQDVKVQTVEGDTVDGEYHQ